LATKIWATFSFGGSIGNMGNRHAVYVAFVGIPQLIVFVIGLPLAGLYFLFRNRHRLDSLPVRARYGLFFGGYKNDRYYWEFFLILRKVAVIAISSFGTASTPEMQSLMLMMILMVCCGLQYIGQPFEIMFEGNEENESQSQRSVLPGLKISVLSMLIITIWAGLVMFKLKESGENETIYIGLTFFTVITNILFVLYLVYILLRETEATRKNV
jgi:hypothetical protein